MIRNRQLALGQFAITIGFLVVAFLVPGWLSDGLSRTLGVALIVLAYLVVSVVLLKRWRR